MAYCKGLKATPTPKVPCIFAKEWVTKKEQWAFCFRLESTMNTNMFSEAFHRVFKRVYLKGLVNKRVDVCLVNLVKFSRDKAFDRAIKLTKGKTTYRTSIITSRRKESLKLEMNPCSAQQMKQAIGLCYLVMVNTNMK